MRILFVNQYFPPDVSATAYLLGELAEDLARHHDVWVVAGRPSYNPEGGSYAPERVHLLRTWSTRFRRTGMAGRLLNYGTFVATSLARAVRVPRPDVVIGMTDPPVIGLIALLAARRHRAPFVFVCQDIFPEVGVALKRADNPVAVWLWRRLNRLLRRRARRVVAIGRDMREKLLAEGVPKDKVVFLPNWANEQAIDAEAVSETRRSLGWTDKFVVMHAGNVGLAQNLETLVEAAARVREMPGLMFVIVGDGAARPRLRAEVERRGLSNVSFLPYRPKDEIQTLMAAADLHTVTLAPGLWGSVVPSKVYGIMALRRPFVAAVDESSEVHRIIDETGAGIRVEPGDGEALARAIVEFAQGGVDAELAGQRGLAEFRQRYARKIATNRYRQMLEALDG